MSESCQGVTSRGRISSHEADEPRSCDAPKEDPEAARARADREAEARREAWSRGEGERGMTSRHGSSQLSPTPPVCNGPTKQERAAAETARRDKPLEDDVVGNMIPGLFAGGLTAGLQAGASGAGIRGIAAHVLEHAVIDVEADIIHHEVSHAANGAGSHGANEAAGGPSHTSPPSTAAGRSSSRAASEVAPEPNQSVPNEVEKAPVGRDRTPYAPGHAPVKIPEAPLVTIRG